MTSTADSSLSSNRARAERAQPQQLIEVNMSTTEASRETTSQMSKDNLAYDVFVNDPPPQDGVLPNGEPKLFSPMASTLIYGDVDAVLTDPGMTTDQARVLGDW